MTTTVDPRIGTDLAGYRLVSVLGRGGMGVVYLAQDLRLKRRVALKLVAPELAADPRFRERFLREAELAASLDHSHIVPVHAAGETDGQLWIAMRYVQGTDLRALLDQEGPLEPARAVALCSQVGEALDAAHAHGLVHRDVKPANVLVTQEGGEEHCYLADFGLARTAELEALPATGTHLSGTVDYTAPEQIAAESADRRADIYSLGCVLYECLVGQPPFKRPRAAATLFAHASEPPPSLHQQRPELPDAIDPVIARALAKDPEERYETCSDLVGAAQQALGLGGPRFTRRQLLLAGSGAAVAVAAAAAVPAILLGRSDDGGALPDPVLPLDRDSVVRIDPATGEVAAAVPFNGAGPITVGEGYVWTASTVEPVMAQIDPQADEVLKTIDLPEVGVPGFLAAGEGSVWLGRPGPFDKFWRYDVSSRSLSRVAPGKLYPKAAAFGENAVWACLSDPPEVVRLDPATGSVVASIPNLAAWRIAIGEEGIWVADTLWLVSRIDPETNTATEPVDLGTGEIADIATGFGALWVSAPFSFDDAVLRVDPATTSVTNTITAGRGPKRIAAGAGALWVTSERDGTVIRIDPATLDLRTVDVGGAPADVAVGLGSLWVTVDVR